MTPRSRVVGGLLIVAVAAVAVALAVAGVRYHIVSAVQDRIVTDYTIGDAQFSAPGLFVWPHMSEPQAIAAACAVCSGPAPSGMTAEYGVLRSDPGIGEFFTGYHDFALTADDVHLPQVVWIVQWPLSDSCRDYPAAPHTLKCANFELVDDSTGWILDAGQTLTP